MRRTGSAARGATLAALLAVALAACAGAEPDPPAAGQPPTDPAATDPTDPAGTPDPTDPAASPQPLGAGDVLTEDDGGREVSVEVGDEIVLRLDNAWEWDDPRIEGDAVDLAVVDYFADPGYREWVILAVVPGRARVFAAGRPACADPADCPPTTVEITVEVRG